MSKTPYVVTYWDRVANNLCIDCGKFPPKAPSRRCEECCERVVDYNKNRRGKMFRSSPTPKQRRKVALKLFTMVENVQEDVDAYEFARRMTEEEDDDNSRVDTPEFCNS